MTEKIEQALVGVASTLNAELGGKLIWHEWTTGKDIPDDVPIDELLLIDLGENCHRRYKTGQFFITANKEKMGYVGDFFWFNAKPTRWASIQHLVDA